MKVKSFSRRLFPLCLIPLLAFPLGAQPLSDWTLDDVLGQIARANGGTESIESVTNVRIRGDVEGVDTDYEFLLLKKRPDKLRLRLMFRGNSIENGFNGTTAWRRVTRSGYDKVEELGREQRQALAVDADFDGLLIGPLPAGMSRRLVGTERIDRVDYFIIEVKGEERLSRHWVDSRTFREHKSEQYEPGEADGEPTRVTLYDDYVKHGGIWVSQHVERQLPGGGKETIRIREVEINPGILDMAFDKPEERNPFPEN